MSTPSENHSKISMNEASEAAHGSLKALVQSKTSEQDSALKVRNVTKRIHWSPELKATFEGAITHFGPSKSTPRRITDYMKDRNLSITESQVKNHLQKYRAGQKNRAINACDSSQAGGESVQESTKKRKAEEPQAGKKEKSMKITLLKVQIGENVPENEVETPRSQLKDNRPKCTAQMYFNEISKFRDSLLNGKKLHKVEGRWSQKNLEMILEEIDIFFISVKESSVTPFVTQSTPRDSPFNSPKILPAAATSAPLSPLPETLLEVSEENFSSDSLSFDHQLHNSLPENSLNSPMEGCHLAQTEKFLVQTLDSQEGNSPPSTFSFHDVGTTFVLPLVFPNDRHPLTSISTSTGPQISPQIIPSITHTTYNSHSPQHVPPSGTTISPPFPLKIATMPTSVSPSNSSSHELQNFNQNVTMPISKTSPISHLVNSPSLPIQNLETVMDKFSEQEDVIQIQKSGHQIDNNGDFFFQNAEMGTSLRADGGSDFDFSIFHDSWTAAGASRNNENGIANLNEVNYSNEEVQGAEDFNIDEFLNFDPETSMWN